MSALLKRTLALEDNLNEANQENKDLTLDLQRYEQVFSLIIGISKK